MFSFRGRIARWPYFLGCASLLFSCVVPVVVAVAFFGPVRDGNKLALPLLVFLLVAMAIVIFWISLALQTRRIRDIGWNPWIILPAWFAVQIADPLVAYAFPAYAIRAGHDGTAVGAVLNLFFVLSLAFWPSTDEDVTTFAPKPAMPSPLAPTRTASIGEVKPVAVQRTSFGRR